ncbi:CP family cyanate transporter-like MFS transporter [Peribacillus huizhouensis]|uniref:CP family cyanate transporter-like MFS transporter n=1 Tax=Peribacillus huizhouensis TaxID=1501239 RepID=A0ABR6CMY3_9BACI|nr:MFS transporter [Peribacillus huizhouensis]MBA9026076.1 CP family cyanate transporter-like MFS transporter [Peribacillus huizhouensis]
MSKPALQLNNHPLTKGQYWLLLIGIIFIGANLRAPITSVGPLLSTIRDELGLSHSMAGSITTVPLIAFALLSPFAPKIAKKLGNEMTIFWAFLVLTFGIAVRILPGASFLFLGTILIGLAIAICNVLLPGLIKVNFPLQMGLMTGIYAVVMNVFGGLGSGLSVPLSSLGNMGWRGSLAVWGILSIIAIIIWSFQLNKKHDIHVNGNKSKVSAKSMWKSPIAWSVTVFMGLQSLVFYTLMTWMPEIIQSYGYSISASGWLLSLLQFAIIPMTFIIPIIAGKLENQRLLSSITAILYMIGFLGLFIGVFLPVWVIVIGIASGSAFGLSMMYFTLRTNDSQQASELSGMAQSIGYLLAAFGPIVFGWLHDISAGWHAPLFLFLVLPIIFFIAGIGAGKGFIEEKV